MEMRLKKMMGTFCVLGMGLSFTVKAQNDFRFDQPVMRGTGCPQGSTSTVISPDQQEMSILFDRFTAEVPQYNGNNDNTEASDDNDPPGRRDDSRLSHKVCNIILSADIPQGQQVSGLQVSVDFRGTTIAAKGSRAVLRSALLSHRGPRRHENGTRQALLQKVWVGEVQEDWSLNLTKVLPMQSVCAVNGDRKVNFALRNTLMARMNPNLPAGNSTMALIAMDSQDLAGRMRFKVTYKPCQGGPGNGPGNGPGPGHGNGHGHGNGRGPGHGR